MVKVQNNLELNIQLQTISGAMCLAESSTVKRNTLIESFNEDLKSLSNLIEEDESIEKQSPELVEFLSILYDNAKKYVSNYGEAVLVLKTKSSEFNEIYESLSYQNGEKEIFIKYVNQLEKDLFDKILGEPFIDEDNYLDEKDSVLSKIKDNDLKRSIESFTDMLDKYFVDINEQNEMILSIVELIKTVKNEVR